MTAHTTEPTEMELRVAEAINDAGYGEHCVGPHQINLARAAIRAMRTPTEEMVGAGAFYHIQGGGGPTLADLSLAKQAWHAMIDAASPVPPK